MTKEEIVELLHRAITGLDELPERVRLDILESEGWIGLLYNPHPELMSRLSDYFEWQVGKRKEDPGTLMEEIAILLFKSIKGAGSFRSFQSYAPQHDLIIDGASLAWQTLMVYLHLPRDGRSIVVEAKNQDEKINDQQFSRLCYIVQNKFTDTADLGVFVSRTMASGFPGGELKDDSRERTLRDARATQALFHSKTGKYVVILDHRDLKLLFDGMPLPKMLETKIREVEAASGIDITFSEDWKQVDLPPHLKKYENG